MSKTIQALARSALILGGGAFGLLRSLRVLDNLARDARNATENAGLIETLNARVDTVHLAVSRLAAQSERLQEQLDQTATRMATQMVTMVTKDELNQALERVFGRLECGVEARFEQHNRSVEALRFMVGQTDELLQRVLDGLEAIKITAEESAG